MIAVLCLLFQVQYTALCDMDGNFVSADTATMLGELHQKQVPEEEVRLMYLLPLSCHHKCSSLLQFYCENY